jgi:hypothetical protein
MLSNLFWMAFPGSFDPDGEGHEPLWLTISERMAVLLLPVFFTLDFDRRFSQHVLILMGLCLILDHAAWLRCFIAGCAHEMLSASLLGISLPMAVFPILLLILSFYLLHSWLMLSTAVFFWCAHLRVSASLAE